MIDLEAQIIRPLALQSLAYPSGLALSMDEKQLFQSSLYLRFVCETFMNRLLRFVVTSQDIYFFSVFHQFSGRLGPTAVCVSPNDTIYVARFEFEVIATDGIISILNKNGQLLNNVVVSGCPEINGLTFSKFPN